MMNVYVGIRKVNATFYTNVEKTEVRTMVHTFKTCQNTIDECRKALTKKVNEYKNNPYIIEVTPISEYFEN